MESFSTAEPIRNPGNVLDYQKGHLKLLGKAPGKAADFPETLGID